VREYGEDGSFVPDPEELFQLAGERTLTELSAYFGEYGDAVQHRVTACLEDATALLEAGHASAAVLRAFTSAELMVTHFIVRPLLSATLMSSEVSEALTAIAFQGANERERRIVPSILNHWGISVESMRLDDGTPIWNTLVGQVRKLRNAVAHEAQTPSPEEAALSLRTVVAFEQEVVRLIAARLGFFVRSQRWCDSSGQRYACKTPESWR